MFLEKEQVMEGVNEIPTLGKTETNTNKSENKSNKLKGGLYILGISSVTAIVAGILTSKIAKNKAREYFKDLDKTTKVVPESPTSLALRALAWATFWSVGFFSLSIFSVWKWYGIKDLDDLRTRMRKLMKKPPQSEGRTEFENLSDFLSYLEETSKKESEKKVS